MKKILVFITLVLFLNNLSAKTWYVNQASGNTVQNGYYWATALKNLRQAIDSTKAGDTIKVAAGTYIPGSSGDANFSIKSGTVLLGGYAASDSTKARNFSEYATILNGRYSTTTPFAQVDHVIKCVGVNTNTVIDGFIIENGYASGGSNNDPATGGGMLISANSNPRILNCLFRNNYASNNGGAIAITGNSSPDILNCIFVNNSSFQSGTVFLQNASGTRLINCVFADNSVQHGASALHITQSSISVTNNTFFRNAVEWPNTSADNATVIAEGGSILSLTNSIFFANKAKELVEAMELSASASTINISNCITQHYTQGTQVLLAVNPRFKDTANLAGPDNKFFTGDDGLQLTAPCSPALNTGNNAAIAGITTDIIAQPRLYNNGVVDLGAYEMQNTPATNLNLVYVNQTATGNNDGSSWTNAFTSLQQALLSCAETIKVAAGTYYPSNNNPASAFWLHSKLVILGGYPKTGNPSDAQRDPFTNISRLSGKIPGNTSQSGNVLFVDRVDSTCIVDGLTISDAVTPQYSFYQSGIRITNNSNPVFINCRIENNISDLGGAMQVSNQARPSFFACSFVNNKSRGAGHGEGGAFRADNAAMPYFKNCRFESNVVAATNILSGDGGAGNIDNAGAAFDSCQFTNNFANYYGGAVYVRGAFPVTFKNCTFAGNFAQEAGNSVYHNGANAAFYQCQFAEPGSTLYGGAVYNLNCSPLFEECVFKLCQARVGGAVYNNQSSPLFKKCVFAQNTSGKGGAMYNVDSRTVGFINCAASYNYSTNGSVFYNERSTVDIWSSTLTVNSGSSPVKNMDSSVLTVKNSIMWANALGVKELLATTFTDIENFTGAVRPSFSNVASSVTQFFGVNGTNNNIVGINPRLVNYNDADGPDNIFFTADDGLRLSPCSPLIDVGNNSYPTGIATDLQRKPRLFGTVIDIGAYEFGQPINTSNTIFVNAVATGTGDGSSWANAYTSFQDALSDICADTVKVAAGVYYAAATSVDSAFSVRYGRVMLAGYPATGNPSDKDRNPILYPTILSGNAGNKGDSLDNVNHVVSVMQADGKVILDGFIIEGGFSRYGNGNINENGGAGVQVITSDITIKNCTIQKNVATSYGGGMYISPSSVFNIEKTLIRNNRVGHSGGGISAGSAGTINNCAFVDNYSETQGGGLYTSGQNIQITNTVFHRNLAGFRAGGVYNDNPVNVKYVNCTFTRNVSSNWEGGGVYVQQTYQGSNALFYNTIFHENALGSQINLQFSDVYFSECGRSSDFCFYSKLFNCRMQGAYTITNPVNGYPAFVDIDNPAGKDGIWLTADDGLRLTHCSVCIDRGQNAVVNTTSKDIAGNDRIQYGTVDLGAYEYNSSLEGTAIVQKAADSVVANKEYTDSLGWTHYFKDCNYLLSIKNQSRNIGSLVNGTLKIGVVTNAGFGTSSALNLSNAAFNTSGGSLYGMNKYWYALSDYTITDSLQVRFPYATKDFEDVKSASQTITSHEQLSFYQARNSSSAHDLNIPASAVTVYQNDTAATLQHFKYFAQEGFHISEFYINQFGSGSAFISNNGPKPDLILTDITVPVNITRSADTFSLGFREKNSGTGRSGYHSAAIYLSPDSALNKTGNTDILLGSLNINQYLQAGEQTVVLQQKITIPCGTAAGNYYLIVSADNNNNVDEANENNNLYFKKLIMEVGPVKPAGLTIVSDHISDKACLGDSIKLTAQITSCVGCKFNWGTGDTTASTYVKANSTYYVSVTNACGQISQGKTVTFKYPPGIVPVADPTQICLGQTVKLYEMVGVDADSIVWSGPGLNNVTGPLISFQPTQSGNLVFTEKAYSNDRLCTTTKTITVRVLSTQMPTLQIAGNGCVAPYIFKVSSVANAGQTPRFVWYKNDTLLNMYDTVITFNNLSQGARIYAKMLPQNPCVKADTVQSNTITFNCAPTGIDDIPGISHFYIGPNPSTGNFVINLLFSMPKQVSWSVYNSYGSKVMEAAASLWSGNIQRSIDLSNMPTGMYHLQLVIDKQPFTYKLLVVR